MTMRSIAAILSAALFGSSLAAQGDCPMERTENVPANIATGPAQGCGGLDYDLGGVRVATVQNNCPLFVIYTPPHQIAVESKHRTQVASVALSPITKVVFRCQTRWFLIFPVGSTCAFAHQLNVGSVQLLVTQPCAGETP